jgi:hypothetical protein
MTPKRRRPAGERIVDRVEFSLGAVKYPSSYKSAMSVSRPARSKVSSRFLTALHRFLVTNESNLASAARCDR